MKKQRKSSFKDRLAAARKHAFAVLQDKGKVLATACIDRIKTETMTAMLRLTYTNGKPLEKTSHDCALIHWSETGFKTYTPDLEKPTRKQQKWSDAQLMRTATKETMDNRRKQYCENRARQALGGK